MHPAFILALGLIFCCGASYVAAEDHPNGAELRPAGQGHNFGMDWQGKDPPAVDVRLPQSVTDACERWAHLPERIEAAASWTAILFGASVATILLLCVATAAQFARGK